jgi:DNA-binding CsgD family transcriptional regulator
VFECDPTHHANIALPDVVEAAARAGNKDLAEAALTRLTERTSASGTAWAHGLLARARALVGHDDVEVNYVESIDRFTTTGLEFELARSRLVYGEWLRRAGRHADAREELHLAYESFAAAGAEAFAARTSEELRAAGERAVERTVKESHELTPQETRIAQLAATGDTNPEIATQLFISASTVDYHLRKVFRKLSVTSRRQLKDALSAHAGEAWR